MDCIPTAAEGAELMSMRTSILAAVLMLMSVALAYLATPRIFLSELRKNASLESTVPHQFGEWVDEPSQTQAIILPETEALLKKLYGEVLSRTYVNSHDQRIMLSIAYGPDQRRGTDLHYPEVCYPAQGFSLTSSVEGVLTTPHGAIQVRRLQTNLSQQRFEPVTYWTTIGNDVTLGGMDKRVKEISYGLRGELPDGLVFRVSSIDRDAQHAFPLQAAFVNELVTAISPRSRKWLAGLQ